MANLSDFIDELVAQLPPGAVLTSPADVESYRRDRSHDPHVGTPSAVVLPETTAHVQATVRVAARHGVPIVPRGRGTGLSGGATAVDGALVVCTERMRSIEVDPTTRTVVAQPGALNAEVKSAAAEHGLWYPPDPASFEICSIGGNVATNAGGLCCVKYGVTADYVLGLTVVLADGRAVQLGGALMKDVAGLPLARLFVGSEGTLGIITSATLRLIPAQNSPATVIATFADLADAMSAVQEITRALRPAMLEFMDRATIDAIERTSPVGFDREAEAVLIIQSDESGAAGVAEMDRIAAMCRAHSAEVTATTDRTVSDPLVAARRGAIPAVEGDRLLLLGDVGVPVPKLGELALGIQQIAAENDVTIALIAHAGDGNTHPLVVVDPDDLEQRERADVAYGAVTDLAIALGGTLTGEHGVGRTKLPWLARNVGPDVVELNRAVKSALDPGGLFNPGAAY